MAQEKSKAFMRKYRIDILVVASLIVLSLVVLLVMNLTRQEGAYAEVTVGENVVGRYPLSQNGTYTLNGGTNVLTIEDGYAYMSYSDCPDHLCEHTGRVKYVGQPIACRPNRVTVTIVGQADDSVDFVS